jgi:hypothetical protein
MRAMTVKIALEIKELRLKISGRPEHRPVETFAANRADQAFNEWMRQRRVRLRAMSILRTNSNSLAFRSSTLKIWESRNTDDRRNCKRA